jgi:hypothetical protein
MVHLKELIEKISKRPGMYIGDYSILNLKCFLDGYFTARYQFTHDEVGLAEFQKWIEKKYKVTTTQSWAAIIRYHTPNDQAALDDFFKLFDEYVIYDTE